jgi:PAS domain S-box-containing protein
LGSERTTEALALELAESRRLREELETAINSSYDGIYVTDSLGRARIVNDAYFRITGLSRGDVFGRSLDELIEGGYIKESVAKKVLSSRQATTILQEIRDRQVIITGTPVLGPEGEVRLVVINIRDITELNSLRDQLETTRRLSDLYYSELSELRLQQLRLEGLVVKSAEMEEVLHRALRVARVDSTVLLEGESGVGKGVIARLIHKAGPRAEKAFIKVNCAAIPEALLESELFGYERGAFTGASREGKIGLFELAEGGTLFLDEIGEVPLSLQVKLLHALESGEIRRVGGIRDIPADVRVIAATNRNLDEMVRQRSFREDLYYRLKVVPIRMPPLRERRMEIPAFVFHFVDRFNRKYGLGKRFSPAAIHAVQRYSWPGNVRELEKFVENLIVMTEGTTIETGDLPSYIREETPGAFGPEDPGARIPAAGAIDMRREIEAAETRLIRQAMEKHGSTRKAASALGISQASVIRKMKRYGIRKAI